MGDLETPIRERILKTLTSSDDVAWLKDRLALADEALALREFMDPDHDVDHLSLTEMVKELGDSFARSDEEAQALKTACDIATAKTELLEVTNTTLKSEHKGFVDGVRLILNGGRR